MGTLYDYINWRGDLAFSESPLNEVDSLIFSLISYLDFKGIVSDGHDGGCVPIKAAANTFFSKNPDPRKIPMGLIVPKDIIRLFRALKDTRRFRNVNMKAHVNLIDVKKEMQFSATTFLLGDDCMLVAYRGTDDTLIGWKENLNMSFLDTVPAQECAVDYLNNVAKNHSGNIYLTGHSKGGNLAVYAGVCCDRPIKEHLMQIWNHDGPGFRAGFMAEPSYLEIRPLIKTFVPQSTVVGVLLEHEENFSVVKSRQAGLFQHNGLTWDVMAGSFVYQKNVTGECRRTDKTLNEWIQKMTPEQRAQFVEALYQILSSDNAATLTDLVSITKNKWLKKSATLDPHVYKTVQKTVSVLFEVNKKHLLSDLFPTKNTL